MEGKLELVILTGPTASGKSAALYALSEEAPIEIINADARQVYQDIEIGTALPAVHERNKFKHHLFAFLPLTEKMSVGLFFHEAKRLMIEIWQRGRIPVICGGTYYYIKTLLDGLPDEPPITDMVKENLAKLTYEEKLKLIEERDPSFYARLDKKNLRRVDRAALLLLAGNRKVSEYIPRGGIRGKLKYEILCPDVSREKLYQAIEERTLRMFAQGFLSEVLELKRRNVSVHAMGLSAIGYREILEMAVSKNWQKEEDVDPKSREYLMALVTRKTKQYARRQLTWLRREKELKKVDPFQLSHYLSQKLGIRP
ncbi:MAG: tRNA (adenosine(37)-N6)-dimethylallyltransferase MiaA [Leptospiraceae bacterium]|nr:tRNA (adenosine(37)-N6)-dimethylallyltransferase MiaA [Leptospiraceae bacterium]MDW8305859.1 tRNA (adenosine(37)-N6)-dimethylallyltransferase MiaA [Leptospiraceae bacterium]